ncbi:kinase-like protein [Trichodelitschia bisporula]|uniref:Kinase-like protein n=1 Tax=Trichodelitschia bisporula TaxID=703511 RepID=A0A6G1HYT7_9PEZI|nr:kinase-like protein [Trichodelitschia bisporula]
MTVAYEAYRGWHSTTAQPQATLEEKYEVLKEIGDGSFGSVALARVRTAGAHVARRGTLVAVKTMKKTFDTMKMCEELREVIFLRQLPSHPHLVPALDIFLDPLTKKLHIAMEYMDGNLYQLMKARDHKYLDGSSVKSILYQIISGLEHVHEHHFFHRDIKPENILVSTSAPQDSGSAFRRYSALVTPPSTPPTYSIKIADFGLARETHSKMPYTTYVSTRWYRAPEVLLRAGEYSSPVDIWAVGAMAVEIATLKPLFPGGNEVDQVWRICEIMGSPGGWVNKQGQKVGGGEWKDGTKLAQKLGFSFPKMAPHPLDTILRPPQWPAALCEFVTWCLLWDPKARPTSTQALAHDYFRDAVDPLRPKSARVLPRKESNLSNMESIRDVQDTQPSLTTKTSAWLRKSFIQRESAPAVPQHAPVTQTPQPRPAPAPPSQVPEPAPMLKVQKPAASKRTTWNGNLAPMPILPPIKPTTPILSGAETPVSAQQPVSNEKSKKIGRQLSVAGNHYGDISAHRLEAEKALTGQGSTGLASPPSGQKEGFLSHLRKRARRFSRHQAPMSPNADDIEANAGCVPWNSNRSSMAIDGLGMTPNPLPSNDFGGSEKSIHRVSMDMSTHSSAPAPPKTRLQSNSVVSLKRHYSVRNKYLPDAPKEEEELYHAVKQAQSSARTLDRNNSQYSTPQRNPVDSYMTPASSAHQHNYRSPSNYSPSRPVNIVMAPQNGQGNHGHIPTPPYDSAYVESEWSQMVLSTLSAVSASTTCR